MVFVTQPEYTQLHGTMGVADPDPVFLLSGSRSVRSIKKSNQSHELSKSDPVWIETPKPDHRIRIQTPLIYVAIELFPPIFLAIFTYTAILSTFNL